LHRDQRYSRHENSVLNNASVWQAIPDIERYAGRVLIAELIKHGAEPQISSDLINSNSATAAPLEIREQIDRTWQCS
jgi:hypothetical protein